jgi:hypothetical protein
MGDSFCDGLFSSAIATVIIADTQCAIRRIDHGHVADLLFPHVKDTFSWPNDSPLVHLTQFHLFNCPPKTLVVHFLAVRIGTLLFGSGKLEASSYSVMTGVNSLSFIPFSRSGSPLSLGTCLRAKHVCDRLRKRTDLAYDLPCLFIGHFSDIDRSDQRHPNSVSPPAPGLVRSRGKPGESP